ncbi:MAG: glycosyltransferase, partial [Oscillospiraceae bacterium]|nr:glycosyltransferase [Oscillospiraceae bacterium]
VYNEDKYIRGGRDSIVCWGRELKVVSLVDDGSPDACGEICDSYAERYPWVKVIHQRNSGVSAARNRALNESHGEWVTFVDADDEVVCGSLDVVLQELSEATEDVVITSAVFDGRDTKQSIFSKMPNHILDGVSVLKYVMSGGTYSSGIPGAATTFMSGCKEKFYRRSFLIESDFFFDAQLSRNEDVLFSCRVYRNANKIRFLGITTYVMKDDPHGITNSMRVDRTIGNACVFIDKLQRTVGDGIDTKLWANFLFHQSLIITGEAYVAKPNRSVDREEYRQLVQKWYDIPAIQKMKTELDIKDLTIPKRIAALLIRAKMYSAVGLEMYIHNQQKRK